MADKDFSADYLRSILAYDADTGVFTRLVQTSNCIKVGDVAGSKSCGYLTIRILGRLYRSHRLAWLYAHGTWPISDIDHIDGNKSNNALANLRDVTATVNGQNQRRAHTRSSHGFLGVTRHGKRWAARITVDGKVRHIGGAFDTPELAHAAYVEAKRRLHEGCML